MFPLLAHIFSTHAFQRPKTTKLEGEVGGLELQAKLKVEVKMK